MPRRWISPDVALRTVIGLLLAVGLAATPGVALAQIRVARLPSVASGPPPSFYQAGSNSPPAAPEFGVPTGGGSALSVFQFESESTPARPTSYLAADQSSPIETAVSDDGASASLPTRFRDDVWQWQMVPDGLIYHSYLAGAREPRFGASVMQERHLGTFYDVTLGGRVGLFRYGTLDPANPQGLQLDFEGAVFPRIESGTLDLIATDYRYGAQLTGGKGPHRLKFGFYHLSSHLGDEFLLQNPGVPRINFCRDALILGYSFYWRPALRLYAETAYAFRVDGGAQPWEFQFGIDYSPVEPTGLWPNLFWAVNGHLREELDFGGNFVAQAGIQWRGLSGNRFRIGVHYYTGMSDQYEFFDRFEDKIGAGLWYDF